jgi:hypothetical protein
MRRIKRTRRSYVPENVSLWGMYVLCWDKYDIHLKQVRNCETRELFFRDYI